jgi:hypothetical protein
MEIASGKRSLPFSTREKQGKSCHPNYHPPVMPDWNTVRPNMNMDFITDHTGPALFAAPLGKSNPRNEIIYLRICFMTLYL